MTSRSPSARTATTSRQPNSMPSQRETVVQTISESVKVVAV